jgi:ribosome recycling factor
MSKSKTAYELPAYYEIKRDGEVIFVPRTSLTQEELRKIIADLARQAAMLHRHAEALIRIQAEGQIHKELEDYFHEFEAERLEQEALAKPA